MNYVVREQVLDVLRRSNAADHIRKAVELLPWFTQEPIAEVDAIGVGDKKFNWGGDP